MRFSIFKLALVSAFVNTIVHAQQYTSSPLLQAALRSEAWNIIDRQVSASSTSANLKTTNTDWLKNIVTYQYSPVEQWIDSQAYTWSGMRPMLHYKNPWNLYTEATADPIFNVAVDAYAAEPIKFDRSNRRYYIQADSVELYANPSPANGEALGKYAYAYDAANRLTHWEKWFTANALNPANLRIDITYNTAGNITQVSRYYDNVINPGSNYIPECALYCTYDANGLLTLDSFVNVALGHYYRHEYYRDAAGRDTMHLQKQLDGLGGEINMYKITYAYTPSGMLHYSKQYNYDLNSNEALLARIDTFGYSGSNTFPDYYRYYEFTINEERVPRRQHLYTFNAAGDVTKSTQLLYVSFTNSWDTTMVLHHYYNANGNPDSMVHDMNTGGPLVNRYAVTYFRYAPLPNNVQDVAMQPIAIMLSPNPASQSITLAVPSAKGNSRGTLMIYDMMGRLLQERGITKQQQMIDISNLPQGIYLAKYIGTDNTVGVARFVRE